MFVTCLEISIGTKEQNNLFLDKSQVNIAIKTHLSQHILYYFRSSFSHDKIFTVKISVLFTYYHTHSLQRTEIILCKFIVKISTIKCMIFFPSMFFVAKPQKKTSIDGLKWRDLVMGRWWLVNFKVSAVRCPVSQRVSCV